jgi:hypothetical protein
MQLHRLRRRAAAALLVALVVGGCTRQSGSAGAQGDAGTGGGSTTTPSASGPPTTGPTGTTAAEGGGSGGGGGATSSTGAPGGAEPAGELADGRHPVRIVALDTRNKTVRFDLIQFLQGAEAEQAYKEEGSGEQLDYFIRNSSKRLRTLATTPGLTVVVNLLAAAETGSSTKDTKITFAKLASYPPSRLADAIFWLTVSHDRIIRIEEQYLP